MPPRTVNKSEFVREMGNVPAVEVVKKAKLRGFSISKAYVYTIRSNANRKAASGSAGFVVRRGRPPNSARRSQNLHGAIDRLAKNLIDEILSALRGASINDLRGL